MIHENRIICDPSYETVQIGRIEGSKEPFPGPVDRLYISIDSNRLLLLNTRFRAPWVIRIGLKYYWAG